MVQASDQVDPYVTPQTLPTRRAFKYLMYMIIAGIVVSAVSAIAFIINNARSQGLRRMGNAIENYMPYLERSYEVKVPSSAAQTSEPDKGTP